MSDDTNTYCRDVEAMLLRASGGPLARITGPDFAVVQGWIDDAIPLSVVGRAIDETAERQRGRGRPVRIRAAYLDRDVRRLAAELRRQLGPRRGERCDDTPAGPVAPSRINEDAERRSRMTTLRLAIERHADRAGAGDLQAWRDELAALEAGDAAS